MKIKLFVLLACLFGFSSFGQTTNQPESSVEVLSVPSKFTGRARIQLGNKSYAQVNCLPEKGIAPYLSSEPYYFTFESKEKCETITKKFIELQTSLGIHRVRFTVDVSKDAVKGVSVRPTSDDPNPVNPFPNQGSD